MYIVLHQQHYELVNSTFIVHSAITSESTLYSLLQYTSTYCIVHVLHSVLYTVCVWYRIIVLNYGLHIINYALCFRIK